MELPEDSRKDLSEEPDITISYSTCDRYKARRKFVAVPRLEPLGTGRTSLVALGRHD
jgi:hypothetical protein